MPLSGVGVMSTLKFQVPGSFTSWAPSRRRACHTRNTAPSGSSELGPATALTGVDGACAHAPPAATTVSTAVSALRVAT